MHACSDTSLALVFDGNVSNQRAFKGTVNESDKVVLDVRSKHIIRSCIGSYMSQSQKPELFRVVNVPLSGIIADTSRFRSVLEQLSMITRTLITYYYPLASARQCHSMIWNLSSISRGVGTVGFRCSSLDILRNLTCFLHRTFCNAAVTVAVLPHNRYIPGKILASSMLNLNLFHC